MDLSLQTGVLGWLLSLLANAHRSLRNDEIEKQKLRFASAATEAANRAKSEFLANMSHELRTPLNAIIGFSDVMQNGTFGPIPERYRDYASDIFRSGNYLLDLINDILDLSKLEAGKLDLHEEEFDRDAIHIVEAQAVKSKVHLTVLGDTALPRVRGDDRRVRQVLINLLSNAVKFTPQGGHVRVLAENGSDGLAVIVRDTGIGIAREKLNIVLEPFAQIESNLSRKHKGTGLGLPIAKRLVELHGGMLTIESEINVGTTVTVMLPPQRLRPPRVRERQGNALQSAG